MNDARTNESCSAFKHQDVVGAHHRFQAVRFYGETWDMRHLDAFALKSDPGLGFEIDVVVLFTCHCFSHSMKRDDRTLTRIPPEEIFDNGIERRVLDKERYELSCRFLPQLVKDLDRRQIRFAGTHATNFFIAEDLAPGLGSYAIFFEVKRDRRRRRRMLLYVQSAYRLDRLTKRLGSARKIRFRKLLKSTYLEKPVHQ
ncbi:MAG: hypothetical protein ACREU3_08285 [Steroidobacteraceae bacterium]